jgi:hypothetical protein
LVDDDEETLKDPHDQKNHREAWSGNRDKRENENAAGPSKGVLKQTHRQGSGDTRAPVREYTFMLYCDILILFVERY